MTSIAIVQRVLPHYRVAFFRGLAEQLRADGIELRVLYGRELPGTVPVTVDVDEPWAVPIANRYFHVANMELVWQRALEHVKVCRLVVIEQANRLLLNYVLLIRREIQHRQLLGLWGHGRNYQAQSGGGLAERIKRCLVRRADWWFAYTQASARDFAAAGIPLSHVTTVNNTIDASNLATAWASTTRDEVLRLRSKLGIGGDATVALLCGGLHPGKEIPFLLEAAAAIRQRVHDFHLIVIGDGPEEPKIREAAAKQPWIHALGAIYGPRRAAYFRLADVMLMPAHIGLAIVDSFITELPLIATNRGNHSPEVEYLHNGENGLVTEFSAEAYAATVASYLEDANLQNRLRAGCRASATRYSLENMVSNFAGGIRRCLQQG